MSTPTENNKREAASLADADTLLKRSTERAWQKCNKYVEYARKNCKKLSQYYIHK